MWIYILTVLTITTTEIPISCPNGLKDCMVYHYAIKSDTTKYVTKYCERKDAFRSFRFKKFWHSPKDENRVVLIDSAFVLN